MKYTDLHCDSITFCKDRGISLDEGESAVNFQKLKQADCAVQCFAIFTESADTSVYGRYFDFYREQLEKHSEKVFPVLCGKDYQRALEGDKTGCLLAVENLGFTEGDLNFFKTLHAQGVRMASLVWNKENCYAYPNLIFDENGMPCFELRERRGLKERGAEAVAMLDSLKIIVDISHLSDGGALQILKGRKIPIVAGHSNASEVCNVSRNLNDELIKKLADCGGVAGVNFCHDFLGGGGAFERIYDHLSHLIKVGGEDIVAFGSDFDGIPPVPETADCTVMPKLIDYLSKRGFSARLIEKIAYKNFYRVFCEVCG